MLMILLPLFLEHLQLTKNNKTVKAYLVWISTSGKMTAVLLNAAWTQDNIQYICELNKFNTYNVDSIIIKI